MFEIGEYVALVSKMTAIVLTVTKQATQCSIKFTQSQNGYNKNRELILDEMFQLINILTQEISSLSNFLAGC